MSLPPPPQLIVELPTKWTRNNPPGKSQLSNRACTYTEAVTRMLRRLPLVVATDEHGNEHSPLQLLNTEGENDWTIGMVQAWAVVADVLSFYQERITNEGFLRTATERLSVLELLREIGYDPKPALAASTYLAFTLVPGEGEQVQTVVIPAGTAVQSVPPPGQLPQWFETSEEITAYSDWDGLSLAPSAPPIMSRYLHSDCRTVRLIGDFRSIAPGSSLLVIGEPADDSALNRQWRKVEVRTNQPNENGASTDLAWDMTVQATGETDSAGAAGIFSLETPNPLFTFAPAGIEFRATDAKTWSPAGIGLPKAPILDLVRHPNGTLYVGTEKDVFRSEDGGATWHPFPTGPLAKQTHALVIDDRGAVLAATAEGEVFRTLDGQEHWQPLSVPEPEIPKRVIDLLVKLTGFNPGPEKLPKAVVRSLTWQQEGKAKVLIAATDKGLYRSEDGGENWKPTTVAVPKQEQKPKGQVPVRDVAVALRGKQEELFAATQAGVLPIRPGPGKKITFVLTLILTAIQIDFPHLLDPLPEIIREATVIVGKVTGVLEETTATKDSDSAPSAETPGDSDKAPPKETPESDTAEKSQPQEQTAEKALLEEVAAGDEKGLLALILKLPAALLKVLPPEIVSNVTSRLPHFTAAFALVWTSLAAWQRLLNMLLRRPARSLGQPVSALATGAAGQLFAGTKQGVFRASEPHTAPASNWHQQIRNWARQRLLPDLARRWQLVHPIPEVTSLCVTEAGQIVVATKSGQLWRSEDQGSTWQDWGQGLGLVALQRLLATPEGVLVVGKPADSPGESRWSPAQARERQIQLEASAVGPSPGAWVLLQQSGEPSLTRLYRVISAHLVDSRDAVRPGQYLRLTVDRAEGLDQFDRTRTTAVLTRSALPVINPDPVMGRDLRLKKTASAFASGKRLFVRGKRLRPAITQGPPKWDFASSEDPTHSELVTIKALSTVGDVLQIELVNPLEAPFDPSTVRILANVVHATNGRTVFDEVLGSSDGSQGNSRFRLRQQPLTFLSGDNPEGYETTLRVAVQGVSWKERPSFHGALPDERVYTVRPAANGLETDVAFGNGLHGARLPGNREQVTATYRVGSGPAGNVPADSLTQLVSSPPVIGSPTGFGNQPVGIATVTNPLPAEGGTAAERMSVSRRAPASVKLVDRIISLRDFHDFARNFPGIGGVHTGYFNHAGKSVLHLSLADAYGQPLPHDSEILQNLSLAINQWRSAPEPHVELVPFEACFVRLKVQVKIAADHALRQNDLRVEIDRVLREHFAFGPKRFARPIRAAEIVHWLHQLAGVVSVVILALHFADETEHAADELPSQPARVVDQRIEPAQMVLLNPSDANSIAVVVEVAN